MIVLCPTRGRPERCAAMLASFRETAALMSTQLVLVLDADDPTLPLYRALPARFMDAAGPYPLRPPDAIGIMVLGPEETGNLVRATNSAVARIVADSDVIGHVGDDHIFRTPGWDRRIAEVLASPGVAYGDDLLMHDALPTAVFMSSVIPRALGWYAVPTLRHLCIDDAWKAIGRRLGVLHYLPDVVIEHMHPVAGKAEVDETYLRGGMNGEGNGVDHAAYDRWIAGPIEADLARVRAALS